MQKRQKLIDKHAQTNSFTTTTLQFQKNRARDQHEQVDRLNMPVYINRNGKVIGPLSDEAFQRSISAGRVQATDQVAETRTGPWQSARDMLPAPTPELPKNPLEATSGTSADPAPDLPNFNGEEDSPGTQEDLFADVDLDAVSEFRDTTTAGQFADYSYVNEGQSEAIVVSQSPAADKNMHYLDAALADEMEADRKAVKDAEENKKKITILAIAGPIIVIIAIVTPFIIYSASRPIRLRMAADTALNRMLLQTAKAEALSNSGKVEEAGYAMSQAASAAVELQSVLDRMSDEQRAGWQESKLEDLIKANFR